LVRFRIADHQVGSRETPLFVIQRFEFCSFGYILYDDLFAFDLIRIKCMQRLASFM
jgi:hypothetical protein